MTVWALEAGSFKRSNKKDSNQPQGFPAYARFCVRKGGIGTGRQPRKEVTTRAHTLACTDLQMDATCTSAYLVVRQMTGAAAEFLSTGPSRCSHVRIETRHLRGRCSPPHGLYVSIILSRSWKNTCVITRCETVPFMGAMRLPVEASPVQSLIDKCHFLTMWPRDTPAEHRLVLTNIPLLIDCTSTRPARGCIIAEPFVTAHAVFKSSRFWDTAILPCPDAACRCFADLVALHSSPTKLGAALCFETGPYNLNWGPVGPARARERRKFNCTG